MSDPKSRLNERAECFAGFDQSDTNCFVTEENKCPMTADCAVAKQIIAEQETMSGKRYDELSVEQRLWVEQEMDRRATASTPPAAPAPEGELKTRTRPGAAEATPPATDASSSSMQTELENELGMLGGDETPPAATPPATAAATPPATPPAAEGKPTRRKRRTKAQIEAEKDAKNGAAPPAPPAAASPPAPPAPPPATEPSTAPPATPPATPPPPAEPTSPPPATPPATPPVSVEFKIEGLNNIIADQFGIIFHPILQKLLPEAIADKIALVKDANPLPRLLICVPVSGASDEMKRVGEIAYNNASSISLLLPLQEKDGGYNFGSTMNAFNINDENVSDGTKMLVFAIDETYKMLAGLDGGEPVALSGGSSDSAPAAAAPESSGTKKGAKRGPKKKVAKKKVAGKKRGPKKKKS